MFILFICIYIIIDYQYFMNYELIYIDGGPVLHSTTAHNHLFHPTSEQVTNFQTEQKNKISKQINFNN